MKQNYIASLVLICSTAVLLIFSIAAPSGHFLNEQPFNQTLTLKPPIAATAQLEGVNITSSASPTTPTIPSTLGVSTNFFRSPEDFDNEQVWKAVADIDIPVLRFPGGEGNWYDWKTGTIRPNGRAVYKFMQKSKPKAVPMDAFMSSARSAGASVSYVLNIMDSPESIRELAFHWALTKAPVRWVEMGNEYYDPTFLKDIGGPANYLRRAKEALKALRDGGFRGAVGLVVAPVEAPDWPGFEGLRVWNRELSVTDTQDFDAIILHYYPLVKKRGFEGVYLQGPTKLVNEVKMLRRQFPGKQIWVTEWNLGDIVDVPEFNSLAHAIFNLRMLRALLDSKVDMACYHVLTGRGWELLGPNKFALEYSKNSNLKVLRRVPYFAFAEIIQAHKGSFYLREQPQLDEIEFAAFLAGNEVRIIAWTQKSISRQVNISFSNYQTHFLTGQVIQGRLLDRNGSFVSKDLKFSDWQEKILPKSIHTPTIDGPGIFCLRFSLSNAT